MATTRKTTLRLALLAAILLPSGEAAAASVKELRWEIVERTLDYLNIPYMWGGQNPKTGLDCSGFVQLVYKKAGLNIPRVSQQQFTATRNLSPGTVLPGDLIFFAIKNPGTAKVDHVGIYLGKGYFVHASFTHGIHIDTIARDYYKSRLVGVRGYSGFPVPKSK